MTETVNATTQTTPIYQAIEIGNGNTTTLSNELNRKLTIANLAQLLSAKGEIEGYPGWCQSETTLRKRITAINKAIPQFQRQPYKPLEPYQVWVTVRVHQDYFKLTPKDIREVTTAIHNDRDKFTFEEFTNEQNRTTNSSRTERNQTRQLIE